MKNKYRVIALDMDGTALNDQKEFTPRTVQAIHRALAAGKEVVFCTGRSYTEMHEPLEQFPDMRYLCGESGAMIYDLREHRPVQLVSIPQEVRKVILDVASRQDVMLQVFNRGDAYVNRSQLGRMAHYQMGVYQEYFNRICNVADDVAALAMEFDSIEKINLYHTCVEDRERSLHSLQEAGVDAELVYSEIASLECSARGLHKGVGLENLCRILGISTEEVIMVGDADNDLGGLRTAGLAVAMGNANDHVKAVCQVQVADNNHDGCAEAIEKYLLREERTE